MGSGMSIEQKDNFIGQFKKFNSDAKQAYAVELWETGENMNMKFDDKVPNGTMPFDHEFGGMPVFQKEVQEGFDVVKVKEIVDGGTSVIKNDKYMAFMPAGFRDGPTPNKINPFREEIGNPNGDTPQKCAASLCHIVSTPIDIRKYNVITCDVDDISLLRELETIGKEACIKMLDAEDDVLGSLKWHLKQDGKIVMKDSREVNTKLVDADFIDDKTFIKLQTDGYESVRDVIIQSIHTTFHVGESASVGYIHSHTRPSCFDLTSKSNMDNMALEKGYVKETDIEDIVKFIESEEFKNEKDLLVYIKFIQDNQDEFIDLISDDAALSKMLEDLIEGDLIKDGSTNVEEIYKYLYKDHALSNMIVDMLKSTSINDLVRTTTVMMPEPEPEDDGLTRTMTPPIEDV